MRNHNKKASYYSGKSSNEKHTETDRFLYINDFGYCKDHAKMSIRRKEGRLDYQLIYVSSGALIIHENGKKRTLKGGDVCLYRPGEPQIYSINGELTTHYWILFTGCEVEKMLSFFKERAYHIGALPEFEHFCHSVWRGTSQSDEQSELLLDGMLITLIASIMKLVLSDGEKGNKFSRLNSAIQIMKSESHLRRSNEELSRLCGISKFYFMKLFKKSLGVSPQEYYTKLIVDKSVHLLTSTDFTVSQIAKLCGVDDAQYFSRMFKKHMGISPAEYRKNIF